MTIDLTGTEAEVEIAYAAIREALDRLGEQRVVRTTVGETATIHATLERPGPPVTPR